MRILTALIISFIPIASAFAFDVEGLRPLSPYGVFSTFSTESLKQNNVGICMGFEETVKPNLYRTTTQLAYGLHDRFEIDVAVPYDFGWENHISGFEDANFGVKHRILDEGIYYPSVAYLLTISTPSGADAFSTHGQHGAGLILTKKVGPFKGYFNLLYDKPNRTDLHEQYNVNLGAELAITHDSKMIGELVGRKEYFGTKVDLLEWRLGYRIATLENLYTTVGAGFNMRNDAPEYRLLFSVSIILPKEKKKLEKIYE